MGVFCDHEECLIFLNVYFEFVHFIPNLKDHRFLLQRK